MDAMSDAIEGAGVMLYGVSLPYKESANVRSQDAGGSLSAHCWCSHRYAYMCWQCRLEANYAHQQELDIVKRLIFAGKSWRTVA